MSSRHLHRQISHCVTFCFILKNHKTPPSPNISVLWLSRASRLLPAKPTSAGGTLSPYILFRLGTSLQESRGLLQVSHRTRSVPVAQLKFYLHVSGVIPHLQSSRVTVLEPSSALLPALPPQASVPAFPSQAELAGRQKAAATAQYYISSFHDAL